MSLGVFFGIIAGVSVFVGANIYVIKKLYLWLGLIFAHLSGKIFLGVYAILFLAMILGFMRSVLPLPRTIKSILNHISAYWMAIFLYLLLAFLAIDFLLFLGNIVRAIPRPMPQNVRFYAGIAAVLSALVLIVYGTINARGIKLASYDIKSKESIALTNMKIVLISDLHLGALNSENNFEKIVAKINTLKPDIVCLAGDTFNDDYKSIEDPERVVSLFKSIKSTYGVYACLGNHDGGSTFDKFVGLFEQSDVRLLNDEYVIIADRLVLLGRVDGSPIGGFKGLKRKPAEEINELLGIFDENMTLVVLEHNPSRISEYEENVDLILCGHTHKGQLFPGNLLTSAIYTVDYGHYQKDEASPHVIVSSGAGTWGMPMRIGSDNEVVSIILR